jgi:ribose/xylose/arabinose/galactoside ABC-type transport system permease subunit
MNFPLFKGYADIVEYRSGTKFLYDIFNIYYLTRGEDVIGQGPLVTFLYTVGVFLVLIVLVGLLFRRTVMGRVRNEIV